MAFPGGNILLPLEVYPKPYLAGLAGIVFGGLCLSTLLVKSAKDAENPGLIRALWLFAYSCFLKPHNGNKQGTQQDALESFYEGQAGAYDATRGTLLKGREDMLGLAAAQLAHRATKDGQPPKNKRRIWVDVSQHLASVFCPPITDS